MRSDDGDVRVGGGPNRGQGVGRPPDDRRRRVRAFWVVAVGADAGPRTTS